MKLLNKKGEAVKREPPFILVAIPTHEANPSLFTYSLAQMWGFTMAAMPEDTKLGLTMEIGTYVHSARISLMRNALERGATHILWLDSDMTFPKEALVHLFKHDLPMVGINYAQRGLQPDYVAIKKIGQPGEKCATTEDSTGVEEVEALGFGCVMMKTSALANMPDPVETPWFQHPYLGGDQWLGEDVHFCKLFRESGQRIFVDHDLSKVCSHIGQIEYQLGMVGLGR